MPKNHLPFCHKRQGRSCADEIRTGGQTETAKIMTDYNQTFAGLYNRFISKVKRTDGDGCWTWTANTRNGRYGAFHMFDRDVMAHRASWLLHRGEIPDGMCVCHKCDNPICVNPGHLFLGTASDNMRDMSRKGRGGVAKGARNGKSTKPEKTPRGESAGQSKLTNEQVMALRADGRLSGLSQRKLAEKYGITQATVWNILNGNTWKHLQAA
jgi:predicted DNA-binding protein (UPF0251 family)